MQVNQDGLIFIKFSFESGNSEYINIASISRIRQMGPAWCKDNDRTHPAVQISVVGMCDDMVIGNLSADEVKNKIDKAIETHYKKITEKFLLDA